MINITIAYLILYAVLAWGERSLTSPFTMVAPLWFVTCIGWALLLFLWKMSMINSARRTRYTRITARPPMDHDAQTNETVNRAVWSIAGSEQRRVWTSPEAIKHFGKEHCDEQLAQFYRYEADARGRKK